MPSNINIIYTFAEKYMYTVNSVTQWAIILLLITRVHSFSRCKCCRLNLRNHVKFREAVQGHPRSSI